MRFGLVLQGRTEGITKCLERIGARRWIGLEFGNLAAQQAELAKQWFESR